jgi:hypothetical protein
MPSESSIVPALRRNKARTMDRPSPVLRGIAADQIDAVTQFLHITVE